ncbi:MAG: hypothetical protein HC911_17040 [Chloroflexaceae bacterium]|nr:hypothetical protein [Chloroflexaceae bacterium]
MSPEHPDRQLLVSALDHLLAVWDAARHAPADAQLRQQRDAAAHAVWQQLEHPLRGFARRWLQRKRATQQVAALPAGTDDQLEALALEAFTLILIELQRTTTTAPWRAATNPVGYLVRIAAHRMIDDYYRAYSAHSRPQRTDSALPTDYADPTPRYAFQSQSLDALTYELPDHTADHATHIIEQLDQATRLHAIRAYWQQTLNTIDWQIVQARFATDPPLPFQQIAAQLGAGWTAAAIRKRYERILTRTRTYFQEQ